MTIAPALLAPLFALTAAALFAMGTLLVKRGLAHADAMTGALVQIAASMVPFALAAPWTITLAEWLSPAVLIFVVVGLLRPSVSTMLANEGTGRLGPTIAATVEACSPLFAIAGGVLFLGERITLPLALGTLGVMGGVVVLSLRGRVSRTWTLWALLFPVGAAAIRSSAHVAVKWGLLLLPNVILAGLVAYMVSSVVALGIWSVRPLRPRPRLLHRGMLWFVAAGLTNGAAIFCLTNALHLGSVVLVSPVVAAYPVFTMLGARLLYRQEVVTVRTVLGMLLVVASVVLITLWR